MAYQIPLYAMQPLQAPYHAFTPDANGTINFANYMSSQASNPAIPQPNYRMAPIVATYADQQQRNHYLETAATDLDHQACAAGRTVSSVLSYYPSGQGGIGAVSSGLANATQWWDQGQNNAHMVGVLRQGRTVWVHDPQYQTGTATRLPMIPGTSNVQALLRTPNFHAVNQVQVQGLGNTQAECQGRTAQWIDNVVRAPGAVAPYPPGTFVSGQVTPGWQVIQRT